MCVCVYGGGSCLRKDGRVALITGSSLLIFNVSGLLTKTDRGSMGKCIIDGTQALNHK